MKSFSLGKVFLCYKNVKMLLSKGFREEYKKLLGKLANFSADHNEAVLSCLQSVKFKSDKYFQNS